MDEHTYQAKHNPKMLVEARQWNPGRFREAADVLLWLQEWDIAFTSLDSLSPTTELHLTTRTGPGVARPGQWIIFAAGKVDVTDDTGFTNTYEPHKPPTPPGSVTNRVTGKVASGAIIIQGRDFRS